MNTPLDSLVREALRPLRPDPAEFREATLEKLRTRQEITLATPKRVAALHALPLFMKGPAAGWLSLPVVTVAALAATLVWAVLRLVRRADGEPITTGATKTPDDLVLNWWSKHAAATIVTLSLLIGTALLLPATALLGVLLTSTLHVTLISLRLASAGHADGATLGRILSEFLGLVGCLLLVAGDWSSRWHVNDLGIRVWVPMALVGGSFLCEWIGGWRERSAARRLTGALPLIVLALLTTQVLAPRMKRPSPARVVHWAETFGAPVTDTVEWLRFSRVIEWLRDGRGLDLALTPAERMLEHAERSGRPVPWATRNAAVVAGLLPGTPGEEADLQLRPSAVQDTATRYGTALEERHGNPVSRTGELHGGLRLAERNRAVARLDLARLHAELSRLARPGWIEALSPSWLRPLTIQSHRYEAAAALSRLEASAAWRSLPHPEPTPWTSGRVALAAACLIVLLCAAVTAQGEFRRPGASRCKLRP